MSLKAAMETVLVVGSTGNIGVSAVTAALRSKRNVLAVVRNQNSADKLVKHVGTSKGITFAEANVASETGVKSVVDQVRAGKLPAFQHVWSSGWLGHSTYKSTFATDIPIQSAASTPTLHFRKSQTSNYTTTSSSASKPISVSLSDTYANPTFADKRLAVAYRESIGYLLEQKNPASTWTICTGSQGDLAIFPVPAMTQGALFSMCIAAARENEKTNVRFNEILLGFRVEVDEAAKEHGVTTASEFGQVYESILADPDIRSSRVRVDEIEDLKKLKYARRF
jgi:NAD(P)-dependent dehydrogenase (short-subunit alcohol dehydrogenase family)